MKKIILCLVTTCLSLVFSPERLMAGATGTAKTATAKTAETTAMLNRLHEIKAMEISKLSTSEKKELRNEVLTIKKSFMRDPVVYISGGALLLIIILLILLL